MENSNTFCELSSFNIFNSIPALLCHNKCLILGIIGNVFILFILIVLVMWYISIKIFEMTLDKISFHNFDNLFQKMLTKYGDCEINKLYLVKSSIDDCFTITPGMNIKEVKINKKEIMNLNSFLKEKVNDETNCQEFIKQLLITLESYDEDCEKFISKDELMKSSDLMEPSELMENYHPCKFLCKCINILKS